MKRWPTKMLKEVAEIKSGAGFPLNKQGLLDQPIPFFKVGDMNTPGNESEMHIFQHSIAEETRGQLGAALLPAGSVVFPKVGAAIGTNKKRILIRPSCVDNNVMGILPGETLTTGFLCALLARKDLMTFASNSNPPSIRKTTVEDWQIPVPPLAEQERIVKLLDEASGLQKLRGHASRRTTALIPAVFYEMFGDPIQNPKGYPVASIGDLLTRVKNGANVEQKTDGIGVAITRIETISNGHIDQTRVKWCEPTPSLLADYRLEVGDILFSHINSPEHIAKTAIYVGEPSPLLHGINLLLLRPDQTKVCPTWLVSLLKLDSSRTFYRQRCKRAVNQASLNQTDLKTLPVSVPPLSLQKEFAQRVAEIHQIKAGQATSCTRLDALFQSMLHRAFNGEL